MANKEQLSILENGVDAWNQWRKENPNASIDLREASLTEAFLHGANLENADLREAEGQRVNLTGANLKQADLSGADLSGADLWGADLSFANFRNADLSKATLNDVVCNGTNFRRANLSKASLDSAWLSQGTDFTRANLHSSELENAYCCGSIFKEADLRETRLHNARFGDSFGSVDFSGADLRGADAEGADFSGANFAAAKLDQAYLASTNLTRTNLSGANITSADLSGAILVGTDLTNANLTGSKIYGLSAWDVKLEGTTQTDLVITQDSQPTVTVSNLKVAQFLYILISNPEIREVLDTITSKVVLILGRFTEKRLAILKALRTELQDHDYIPVLFDFEPPNSRDLEETVSTLAHMARFIIADITDPKAIPQELSILVRNLQSVPVVPLLHESGEPWGMFSAISRRSTVLPILEYKSELELISKIKSDIIEKAEKRAIELTP